jgi:hypothetical protein
VVYFFHAFHDNIFYVWNSTTSSSRGILNIDKEGILLCHTFSVQLSKYNRVMKYCRTTDSQLKITISTNCCIYTEYLLMMGYTYARNMYRLIDEINWGKIVHQVGYHYTDVSRCTVNKT